MTANVTFHVAGKDRALRVPNAATRLPQPPAEMISKAGQEALARSAAARAGRKPEAKADKAEGKAEGKADGKGEGNADAKAERSDRTPGGFARVWVEDPEEPGKLKPVRFRVGLKNGTHKEVADDSVKEGDLLVTGLPRTGGGPGGGTSDPFGGAGGGPGRIR